MKTKKFLIVGYYFVISVLLILFALVIPSYLADEEYMKYTNAQLSEIKVEGVGVKSMLGNENVKRALDAGWELKKSKFKALSGQLGLLSAIVVLGFTIIFTFTRITDTYWIAGYFSVLFSFGSMNVDYFIVILACSFATFLLKRRQLTSRGLRS